MAWTFVQGADIDGNTTGTVGISKAFATAPTPGNLIVCMSLTLITGATCTFTDTYGSTINVGGSTGTAVSGSSITMAVLAGVVASGSGTDTVAAAWSSASSGYMHMAIAEFSGLTGTVTNDGFATLNASVASSPFNGAQITTTQSSVILVEYMASSGTGGVSGSWTALATADTGGNASGYQVNVGAATQTAAFTDTTTGGSDATAIAAYYGASAGSPDLNVYRIN